MNKGNRKNLSVYNWEEVQNFYNTSNSKKTRSKFGISEYNWKLAQNQNLIFTKRLKKYTIDNINELLPSLGYRRRFIKKLLLELGILKYECGVCKIFEWMGKRLSLQLDHINGINNDNRVKNLRLICPNCHSQTSTYAGKNKINIDRIPKPNYICRK